MSFKSKRKIEMFIFIIISMVGFAGVGVCLGLFIGKVEKSLEGKTNAMLLLVICLASLAYIMLTYFVNICLHETGHMIFGLLTGYKFSSLRFGKLMLVKKEGKLEFCRYSLPGTGGQCIMTAPECSLEEMPVVLYNLGGLIINLIFAVLGFVLFLCINSSNSIIGMLLLIFALTAFLVLITNGLPFVQLGTDGANTIILYKDLKARSAFRNQLEVAKYMSDGYAISEMPEQLFNFDKSTPMTNPLVTAQAVNCYNYLSANKKYEEAREMILFILNNASSINQLHEKLLYAELIFINAVIDKDFEAAKTEYKKHEKDLKSIAGFISMQRVYYAYFTLVEPNENKANDYAKLFAKSVKNYPYPKDAAFEQEQFDMVAEVLKSDNQE